jgi:hypothetical protein
MLLLFPCPGTIRVASCPASFWLTSSTLLVWVWFPLSTPSTTAPTLSFAGDPVLHPLDRAARGDHRRELPQGVHGHGRHAWQPWTPQQTARPRRDSHAVRPGGPAASKRVSFSDPPVSSPSQQEKPRIRPGTVFLSPCGEVFACPWLAAPSQPPQRRYPQHQQKPPMRIDL